MALRRKLREPQDRGAAGRARPAHRPRHRSPRRRARARGRRRRRRRGSRAGRRGRELARSLDPLLASEHAFPGVGFFERREVAKLAEQPTADRRRVVARRARPIRTRRCGATSPRSRCAIPLAPPLAIARAIDAWRAGPPSLRGDGDAIRELLVEKLTTAGGEVRAGTVTEVSVSWGKISSVTLAERRRASAPARSSRASRRPSSSSCSARRRRSGSPSSPRAIAARRLSLHAQHRHRRGRHPRAHGADGRGDRRSRQGSGRRRRVLDPPRRDRRTGRVVATIAAVLAGRRPDRRRPARAEAAWRCAPACGSGSAT